MANKARTELRTVKTEEFRVAFPHMFTPQAPFGGQPGPGKYSLVMLFPEDQPQLIANLKQAAQIAGEDLWGNQFPQIAQHPEFKSPFRNGTVQNDGRVAMGKERLAGYDDHVFITATSLEKPHLVDHNVQDIMSQEEFYAGCYARAQVYAHAYQNKSIGISFFLNMVQKTRDGDKFTARRSASDVFDTIASPAASGGAVPAGTVDPLFGGAPAGTVPVGEVPAATPPVAPGADLFK